MDIDKLISLLKERKILSLIQNKRISSTELPARVYVKLIIASLATKKSITNVMATALETYVMRNETKHLEEIKIQAADQDKQIEEYLAEVIQRRVAGKQQED